MLDIQLLNNQLKKFYKKYEYQNIHFGGCGFVALFIHQEFLKFGINTEIQIFGNFIDPEIIKYYSLLIEEKDITDLSSLGIDYDHIANHYGNYYIDAEGHFKDMEYIQKFWCLHPNITISPLRLRKMLKDPKNWNSWYDRKLTYGVKKGIEDIFKYIS